MQTEALPTRATVAAELVAARDALLTAEQALLDAAGNLAIAKSRLTQAEDRVLLTDPPLLDGKNEAIRGAQLRSLTTFARESLEGSEWERMKAVSALEGARATFSAAKVLARLLGSEG